MITSGQNSNDFDDFDNYLASLSIPREEKFDSSVFYRKKKYIDELNRYVVQFGSRVPLGYGNYLSKIMIVLKYGEYQKDAVKFLKPIFKVINLSIYNTYVTFMNKTCDHKINMKTLECETKCICPSAVIYVVDDVKTHVENKNLYIHMDDIRHVLNGDTERQYRKSLEIIYKYIPQLIMMRRIENNN